MPIYQCTAFIGLASVIVLTTGMLVYLVIVILKEEYRKR